MPEETYMDNGVQIVCEEPLFEGFVNVLKRTMNVEGQEVSRTVISLRKPAVMVVAIDTEGNLLFVNELAAPKAAFVNTLVKGAQDEGKSPVEVAHAELTEEIGYVGDAHHVLCEFDDRPTHLDTTTTVVVVSGCQPSRRVGGDEEEGTIDLRRKPLAEVLQDPLSTFRCARSVAALFEIKVQMEAGLTII